MKTTPLTPDDLAASVMAVPPLARGADLSLNAEENGKLIAHLEGGGVRMLLYGGNANFYNLAPSEFTPVLDMLADLAGEDTLVVPSVGPSYGVMMDQAAALAGRSFPTAMVLPATFAAMPGGVETGIRHFSDKAGIPVVLYIKHESYLDVDAVGRLVGDGLVSVIKYAIERDNPLDDDYLRRLTERVDPSLIMSGMGEQPTIVHLDDYNLGGFTSGCVCVAPRLSMNMLRALRDGDQDEAERIRLQFAPLEDLRNAISPIRVLHDAVTASGVADMGPMLPLLTNVPDAERQTIEEAAQALLELEQEAVGVD